MLTPCCGENDKQSTYASPNTDVNASLIQDRVQLQPAIKGSIHASRTTAYVAAGFVHQNLSLTRSMVGLT